MTSSRSASLLFAGLLVAGAAIGAEPTPAAKKAFLGQQAIYLSIEITEAHTQEFGTHGKDVLTDKAHRYTYTAKFEVPFEKSIGELCPPSSQSASSTPDTGQCVGWATAPPDMEAAMAQMMSGKVDMAKNPMYSPVEFSVDGVSQYHYRDTPATGFATDTTTSKGRGTANLMRSGMLMCDLKKMTCDLHNVITGFQDGTDLVTVTTTSDVPGFEARKEMIGPKQYLPKISQELGKQLVAFPITLPEPITKVLSEGAVSVKLTLSQTPAPKPAASAR